MTREERRARRASDGERLTRALLETAATLQAAGFPALSPFWTRTLARFLSSGVLQLVARVGRRGGKSTTACLLAVVVALFGEHQVPPGDVGVVAIVSVNRDEASNRLRTIAAILDALRIRYRRTSDAIELDRRPVAFRVFTASIQGVVGSTVIFAICDEVPRWRDAETGANPATEVLASLRPAMATQLYARIVLIGSPLGSLDAHARAFDAGDTETQHAVHGPTWIANPTVSEDATRELEPDARVWRREYSAEPQAAVLAAFDADAVARAFQPREVREDFARVGVLDPSSGGKDAWTWGVCGWSRDVEGETFLAFDLVDGTRGRFWQQLPGEVVLDRMAAAMAPRGVRTLHSDQRERLMLQVALARRGFGLVVHEWTNPAKVQAVETLRRWLREGLLALPDHEQLRRELLSFEERISPTGSLTFGARGSGHDDFVALLITGAMADGRQQLARAAFRRRPARDVPTRESAQFDRMVGDLHGPAERLAFEVRADGRVFAVRGGPRRPRFGGF